MKQRIYPLLPLADVLPCGPALLKAVIERLVGLPESDHLFPLGLRLCSLNQDAGDEVGNSLHLGLAHTQARDLDGAQAQPTG
jgi:hypothetical protein